MSVMRYGAACAPAGTPIMGGALGVTGEPTHEGCEGGHTTPGLLGGWQCPCDCHRKPSPGRLWKQAEREHPDDIDKHRARYRELMIEHGHLVPTKPGEDRNLPCGWPGRPAGNNGGPDA